MSTGFSIFFNFYFIGKVPSCIKLLIFCYYLFLSHFQFEFYFLKKVVKMRKKPEKEAL